MQVKLYSCKNKTHHYLHYQKYLLSKMGQLTSPLHKISSRGALLYETGNDTIIGP